MMPKKNGKQVYEQILRTKPALKVLFTSGYTREVLVGKGIYESSYNLILKPLSPNELLQKVREILDG
ncbi:MAG TPA: hypothetical protein VMT62_13020, partial [Syntrophorhabdaceae bacterium]|nr:hypothetical protein [Syntrophorhabdaceae bacterium]